MIVVDTSIWIEVLRATGSAGDRALTRLLEEEHELAVTEVVVLELLAGAVTADRAIELRSMLLRFPVLELGGLAGFEEAADLYRACSRAGEPPRSLVDCLIAVPTIAADATLLCADRDFERLARHTPLRLEPLDT